MQALCCTLLLLSRGLSHCVSRLRFDISAGVMRRLYAGVVCGPGCDVSAWYVAAFLHEDVTSQADAAPGLKRVQARFGVVKVPRYVVSISRTRYVQVSRRMLGSHTKCVAFHSLRTVLDSTARGTVSPTMQVVQFGVSHFLTEFG